MPNVLKVALRLDLKGLACPMPVLYLGKTISDIKTGEVIEALVNDPTALASFPAWARVSGNEIIDVSRGAGEIKFLIKKG